MKYVREEDAQHLVTSLSKHYNISQDWEGKRYLGMTLDWDYEKHEICISMLDYVAEALIHFQQKNAKSTPSSHKKYGAKV